MSSNGQFKTQPIRSLKDSCTATQGISFYCKETIYNWFLNNADYKAYAKMSLENTDLNIDNLYDSDRALELIQNIIRKKSEFYKKKLEFDKISTRDFEKNCSLVIREIQKFVGEEMKFCQLHDEEQEIELEIEQEQEKEVERPKRLDPVSPFLHKDVEAFVKSNVFDNKLNVFVHLPESLKDSSFYEKIQSKAWSQEIFTTVDFTRTVKTSIISGDDFLRPPRWIAKGPNTKIVILSGYEANLLKPYFFRNSVSLILLIPRTRQDQLKLFCTNDIDLSPTEIEELSVFAGSQYFNDTTEQEAYLNFISFCPNPRTAHQQSCFELDMIQKTGFVPAKNREIVFQESQKYPLSAFETDPTNLICKLSEVRAYGVISRFAHHLLVLLKGRKPLN